jgi:hypothetical protein
VLVGLLAVGAVMGRLRGARNRVVGD